MRAALEVLTDHGMPGLTMEAIADRAGASKATLYRHWPSPAALLVDAMDLSFQPLPVPDTGRLRTDLVELLSRFEALLGDQAFPRLLAAVVDAAEREPALARLHVQLTERRREPGREVLVRAQRRGELPASADLELAIDLLSAPLFYRRFIAHRAFPEGYAVAVVDHVLAALSRGS
jgi:AcrR family transcriptional regulator